MDFVKASTKVESVDTGSTAGGGAGGDGQRPGIGAGEGSTPANQQPGFKPVTYDRDWGKFEKHTKGFGSKYLAKFNFKGRLGKQEQGITRPISVMTRLPEGRARGDKGGNELARKQRDYGGYIWSPRKR